MDHITKKMRKICEGFQDFLIEFGRGLRKFFSAFITAEKEIISEKAERSKWSFDWDTRRKSQVLFVQPKFFVRKII